MSSQRNRSRVSQACIVCSSKKIKCDGKFPACSICIVNERKCIYGVSKRNTRMNKERRESVAGPETIPSLLEQIETPTLGHPNLSLDSLSRVAKEDLFRTFFTCIHPIWPVIYKPLYDGIAYFDLANVLPKPLVHSMFAIASCYSGQSRDQNAESTCPAAKPDEFFQSALLALQCGGEGGRDISFANALKASIPNCQALTILALQQHGVAEFSRAGVLCTLAAGMAIDLRLHRDIWSHDAVQKEVASRLWWNLFILDTMLATEMGRPIVLRSEDTDAPYPSASESDEYELFSQGRERTLGEQEGFPVIKLRTISAFHTTIETSKLMEQVTHGVYRLSAREKIRQDRSYGDKLRIELSHSIDEWKTNCEAASLGLNYAMTMMPPSMVTNYVAINYIKINLHRPFIAYWEQVQSRTGLAPFTTPDPAEVCYQSSKDICLILDAYSKYLNSLPSDIIFVIFSVTESLFRRSSELSQRDPERTQIQRYVRICYQSLGIFSKNWRNASARQELLKEKYNWPTSLDGNPEPTELEPAMEATQYAAQAPGFDFDIGSDYSLDETHFTQIWNEIRDWGFLPPNSEDSLHQYNL